MITMGENSVKATGYRVSGTYFRKCERAKQTDYRATDPRNKKYFRDDCFVGNLYGSSEDSHTNDQTHHNHGEIEEAEFGFNRHGYADCRCLVECLLKVEGVRNQNRHHLAMEH